MKRREFFGIAAAGLTGAVLPVLGGERPAHSEAVLALPRLLALLPARAVYELGERYCEMTPAENSEHALRRALWAELDANAPLAPQLEERVRRDFAEARMVTVNGWVLSVTEARQCALHAIVAL